MRRVQIGRVALVLRLVPVVVAAVAIVPALARGDETSPISNSVGARLVLIPAGEFVMGSPNTDKDAQDDEQPQHRVRITRPFYLGETEVTQGQYQRVMGENPSFFRGADDLPVERVSWDDAISFCNRLSEREGLKPYYVAGKASDLSADGYRLPTEAEAEYACRAGTKTRFSFGDDESEFGNYAWCNANSKNATHPVRHKKPNAWGLYDMHGNVWEWCGDAYEADYYRKSSASDPIGPTQAELRVNRGGAWSTPPLRARSAFRRMSKPDLHGFSMGLRVARTPSER